MTSLSRYAAFAVLALFATSSLNAQAGTITVNGIAPFDTNLGTLIHALVTIDPVAVQTSTHTQNFGSISSHNHLVHAPPVIIPGLDTFTFATIPTTPSSSNGINADHSHNINLLASIKSYSGVGLNWFLDQQSTPVTSIHIPTFPTSMSENHDHTVTLPTIIPRTTFTFTDPVPEPATLGLILFSGLALTLQRRRVA